MSNGAFKCRVRRFRAFKCLETAWKRAGNGDFRRGNGWKRPPFPFPISGRFQPFPWEMETGSRKRPGNGEETAFSQLFSFISLLLVWSSRSSGRENTTNLQEKRQERCPPDLSCSVRHDCELNHVPSTRKFLKDVSVFVAALRPDCLNIVRKCSQ